MYLIYAFTDPQTNEVINIVPILSSVPIPSEKDLKLEYALHQITKWHYLNLAMLKNLIKK